MTRVDPTVNFNFGTSTPSSVIPARSPFSIRWTGQVVPPTTGDYKFSATADDGIRIWVDGQLVVDDFTQHAAQVTSGTIPLVAGTAYDIRVDYFQNGQGVGSVVVKWAGPGVPLQVINPSALSSTPPAGAGTLNAVTASNTEIDLDWTGSTAATGYVINRSNDGGLTWSAAATTAAGQTHYADVGLTPASGYEFRVAPAGSADTSTPSNIASAATLTSVPEAPAVLGITSSSASLSWSDIPGETGFIVLQQTVGGGFAPIATLPAGTTSMTVQNLPGGTEYEFEIEALNPAGAASAPSAATPVTTIPNMPAGVTTAAISPIGVVISWSDVTGEAGFIVERSLHGADIWSAAGTVGSDVTTFSDATTIADTAYDYRVRSVDLSGASDPSDPVSNIVTFAMVPSVPSIASVTSSSAVITWADVPSKDGFVVLTRIHGAAAFSVAAILPAGTTSVALPNLSGGTIYDVAIEALNSAGIASTMSPVASALTFPDTPARFSAIPLSPSGVGTSWSDVAGETGYVIERTLHGAGVRSAVGTVAANATNFTDTSVAAGLSYDYRLRSVNGSGTSDPSNAATGVVTLAAAPTSVTATTFSTNQINLSWTDVPNEQGFRVLESIAGGPYTALTNVPSGTLSYAVTGLPASTLFAFEAEAINSAGAVSPPSASSAATTLTAAPTAANAVGLSAGTAQVTWSAVTGATGYVVEQSADGLTGWSAAASAVSNVTTLVRSGLSAGTTVYFRVRAVNAGGPSTPSSTAAAITFPAAAVASLTGLSSSQSQVGWNAVTGATQYVIQRSNDGRNGWTTVASGAATDTSAVVSNPAYSTTYFDRVIAGNGAGMAAPSATVSQMTAPNPIYVGQNVMNGVTQSGTLHNVDMAAGSSTPIGQLAIANPAISRDTTSDLIYYLQPGVANPQTYSWDPATGNNTPLGALAINAPVSRSAFALDDTPYFGSTDGKLYRGNRITQTLTLVGTLSVAGVAMTQLDGNMAFSPNGVLFLVNGGTLYMVNTTTAAATPVGNLLMGNVQIAFGKLGLLYATTPGGAIYTLNPATAVGTVLNSGVPSFTDLTFAPVFTDLSISAAASPAAFHKGQTGAYAVTVTNYGPSQYTDALTVTMALPNGLTFVSGAGTGWTVTAGGSTVTLSYTGTLAIGATAPVLTLTVAVSDSVVGTTATTFTVAGDTFDTSPANNTAIVTTAVI